MLFGREGEGTGVGRVFVFKGGWEAQGLSRRAIATPKVCPGVGDGRPFVNAHRRMNATEFERFLLGERGGAEVF